MKIDTFVLSSDKHFIDSPRKSVFLLLLLFSITWTIFVAINMWVTKTRYV